MKVKDIKGISKEKSIFFVVSKNKKYKKAVKLSKNLTIRKPFSKKSSNAPIIDYTDYLNFDDLFKNFVFIIVMITEKDYQNTNLHDKYTCYEL